LTNLVNLFPTTNELLDETPEQLLERTLPVLKGCDKVIIITVDDRAGFWQTNIFKAGASNAEANLAIDIVKKHLMETITS
jgi:hypothetical protein